VIALGRTVRRQQLLVAGAVLLGSIAGIAALAVFVWDHAFSLYDDAFIYLRYVKNLRAGCGVRFNCSEPPVEGFSGPPYLALLALGSRFTTKLVTLTGVIGAVATAGAMIVAAKAATQSVRRPAPAPAPAIAALAALAVIFVLAADHYVLLNAVIGLETACAALAAVALYAALAAGERPLAIALAFALLLLRPEGVLFVVFLPLLPWARSRRVLVILAVGLAAVVLARWLVFHDVAPNTYWAKSGGTARHVALGARYLLDAFVDFPLIALSPLALLDRTTRPHATYALAASGVWLASLLDSGGDTFEYSRLVFPLVPMLTVMAVGGAFALAERAIRPRARALAVAGALALALSCGYRAHLAHQLEPSRGFDNVVRWTAVGKYLKAHAAGKTIATVPVGAIAYYSELDVIDLVGLNSRPIARAGRTVPPEMLTKKWIGHERHDLEYVLARAPDLVVTTKFRERPWRSLDEASAGFYADWLILRAAKNGAPYRVEDLPIEPSVHVLALARTKPQTPLSTP
jgi:hypothetical protein